MKTVVLVYQAGIANVVELTDAGQKRLMQASFAQCEWFMRGLQHAGADVDVAGCNEAGDILNRAWTRDLYSLPFSDKFGCAWMQKQDSDAHVQDYDHEMLVRFVSEEQRKGKAGH